MEITNWEVKQEVMKKIFIDYDFFNDEGKEIGIEKNSRKSDERKKRRKGEYKRGYRKLSEIKWNTRNYKYKKIDINSAKNRL